MSVKVWPHKDPESNLRHYFDWRPWIVVEAGGTIDSYTIAIDEGDAALLIGDHVQGTGAYAGVIMVWLSGGTLGTTYHVRISITLTDGTIEHHTRLIEITQH